MRAPVVLLLLGAAGGAPAIAHWLAKGFDELRDVIVWLMDPVAASRHLAEPAASA